MKLNELRDNPGSRHKSKRVGRGIGSGKGKTAGRGNNGQKSRAGVAIKGFEGGQMPLYRRLPKRGFNNIFKVHYSIVNIDSLNELFPNGGEVSLETLVDVGALKNANKPLKVLGRGEVAAQFTVKTHKCSASARAKSEAGGGTVQVIS